MTLCNNTNCAKRCRCYRYLEGLRQETGLHSYYKWNENDEDCDLFIDIGCDE